MEWTTKYTDNSNVLQVVKSEQFTPHCVIAVGPSKGANVLSHEEEGTLEAWNRTCQYDVSKVSTIMPISGKSNWKHIFSILKQKNQAISGFFSHSCVPKGRSQASFCMPSGAPRVPNLILVPSTAASMTSSMTFFQLTRGNKQKKVEDGTCQQFRQAKWA